MSIAPHSGIVDFGTFTSPAGATDGIQGEVPAPLAIENGYVLTTDGWVSASSLGLVNYQGTWDAATNTPTLVSSVGITGGYYVVSVAGSTNLNGITSWFVGDWAIFNGTVWQKVNGTMLGTMAYQNANAVAITGGTINGTTIGATTPSTVNATTITGQTANITGTGQNLLLQSNTFTNGVWTLTNTTVATTVATTDPLGGSNAYKLTDNVTNANHTIQQNSFSSVVGQEYLTSSIYVKSAEYSQFQIDMSDATTGNVSCIFNLSTATAGAISTGGSWTNASTSITNIGNGWYRCALSASKGGGSGNVIALYRIASAGSVSFAGTGTSGIYIYGSQLEAANSVGVSVITTSAVVFNAPALQLAGNTVLRLDQFGNLSVSPSFPSGALQAQATTSTTAGGNARGANAVDWSTSRAAAAYTAIGPYSVIGGGASNYSASSYSTTAGGIFNFNAGFAGFIGAGQGNTVNGSFASVVTGYTNTANGIYNFIGGGFTNSGTANAAVTTQSATMNGTTAVTLSGSNANIKVGQYISGTSIGSDTYVAAISGTSLTLSKNASGSSTSTLSFFTPHGVVVGGGNNQATGSYSFIGGGGDAGTAANRNVASGDWSVVCGGAKNLASGAGSFIGGGGFYSSGVQGNTASGAGSGVVSGFSNQATSEGSFVGSGDGNLANGLTSAILGGRQGTTRSIVSNQVFPACYNPVASGVGLSQSALLILGRQTTDATATALTSNTNAASNNNQVILPNNSAYYFKGSVIANVTGAANGAAWSFEGAIMRGANAASTVLIDTPSVNRVAASSGATAWTIAITADTTNGGLRVTVTGVASTTIRWVAKVETTEVTF